MNTAQILSLLNDSISFTAEIAGDIDALLELVNNPDVPQEVVDKANELKTKLADAAAKFTV